MAILNWTVFSRVAAADTFAARLWDKTLVFRSLGAGGDTEVSRFLARCSGRPFCRAGAWREGVKRAPPGTMRLAGTSSHRGSRVMIPAVHIARRPSEAGRLH